MVEKGISEHLQGLPLGLGCREVVGSHDGTGLHVAIAVSRYNQALTGELARSVVDTLRHAGVPAENLLVVWVPGAFEIPAALEQAVARRAWDALIALGVVIEGQTNHADLIAREVAARLAALSTREGVPVLDGVVCTRTLEQAEARCRPGAQARGPYIARAALEMAHVYRLLKV